MRVILGPDGVTRETLAPLGLYSPFDVSKWCVPHGVSSIYIAHENRTLKGLVREVSTFPAWLVLDATKPGRIIKRFPYLGTNGRITGLKKAENWVEMTYGVPMVHLHHITASFSAPATEMILESLNADRVIAKTLRKSAVPVPTCTKERKKARGTNKSRVG